MKEKKKENQDIKAQVQKIWLDLHFRSLNIRIQLILKPVTCIQLNYNSNKYSQTNINCLCMECFFLFDFFFKLKKGR